MNKQPASIRISVIGLGPVGLTTVLTLAEFGLSVTGLEVNEHRLNMLLNAESPFYEEDLDVLLRAHTANGRVVFTANSTEALAEADIVILCVGTPKLGDSYAPDLRQVYGAVEATLAAQATSRAALPNDDSRLQRPVVIVEKSTVPPNTAKELTDHFAGSDVPFEIISNPEFLREGTAVWDTLFPDRVIVGTDSVFAETLMRELYGVQKTYIEMQQERHSQGLPYVIGDSEGVEGEHYIYKQVVEGDVSQAKAGVAQSAAKNTTAVGSSGEAGDNETGTAVAPSGEARDNETGTAVAPSGEAGDNETAPKAVAPDFVNPIPDTVFLYTETPTAELIKHASNSFLATKISYINFIARICEATGANVEVVAKGMGLDHRISPHFLRAGLGYGGSCFPKDVRGLIDTSQRLGVDPALLLEVEAINDRTKLWAVDQLEKLYGNMVQPQGQDDVLADAGDGGHAQTKADDDVLADAGDGGYVQTKADDDLLDQTIQTHVAAQGSDVNDRDNPAAEGKEVRSTDTTPQSLLTGKHVTVLGFAFKPGTDDTREAPAIDLVTELVRRGANVVVCDPVALGSEPQLWEGESVRRVQDHHEAIVGSDCVIVATEWPIFKELTPQIMVEQVRDKILVDARNLYDATAYRKAGLVVQTIGNHE